MHKQNCWTTLTYDDANIPKYGNLQHKDFQDFIKRVRKKYSVRYYMCGEYGETTNRPHYHACIFGHDWDDKKQISTNGQGDKIYISEELKNLWKKGQVTTAELTFESAAYTARYCVQKITGYNAKEHYKIQTPEGEYQLTPEYNKMSLKPGIGAKWSDKYKTDIYPHDYVVIRGKESRPAKYYDIRYEKQHPDEMEEIKQKRILEAYKRREDNTTERLIVKEEVTLAAIRTLKRTL